MFTWVWSWLFIRATRFGWMRRLCAARSRSENRRGEAGAGRLCVGCLADPFHGRADPRAGRPIARHPEAGEFHPFLRALDVWHRLLGASGPPRCGGRRYTAAWAGSTGPAACGVSGRGQPRRRVGRSPVDARWPDTFRAGPCHRQEGHHLHSNPVARRRTSGHRIGTVGSKHAGHSRTGRRMRSPRMVTMRTRSTTRPRRTTATASSNRPTSVSGSVGRRGPKGGGVPRRGPSLAE